MNVQDSQLSGFRAEAREWLERNFPKSLAGRGDEYFDISPRYPEGEDWAAWRRAMGEKGWGTPTWPAEYGGGGLTRQQALILRDEMEKIGAFTPMIGIAQSMFGPTMLGRGHDPQRHP